MFPFKPSRKFLTISAGMLGNVLEWYDFALYGFLAVVISKIFFQPGDPIMSLISTYGIFAVGFFARPIGAWFFGYIGDVFDRRRALLLSVLTMGIATFLLGALPTYETVGIWATVFLIILRLFQGLSVGGEFSSSVTYMVENAPKNRRGFFGSFANIGANLGLLFGVAAAAVVTAIFSQDTLYTWGWRIPFLLGGVLGTVTILVRQRLPAHVIHKKEGRHSAETPIMEAFHNNRRELLEGLTLSLGYAVFFYLALVYLPTYANEFLDIPLDRTLEINMTTIGLSIFLIPVFGYLSDTLWRRKKMIIASFIVTMLISIPAFAFLSDDNATQFAIVQSLLALIIAVPLGAAPALYVELFPKSDRLTSYSITYNISLGIFGGTTPVIITWLIHVTGNHLMPAFYLIPALIISVVGLVMMRDRSRDPLR
ncbi:MAG: MFS transporter [Nitrosopumilaceae archaeon]|jgi:MHS family proline/betaine transporter-like MFS transporter